MDWSKNGLDHFSSRTCKKGRLLDWQKIRRKRKFFFFKDNISRIIDTASESVKTSIPLMTKTVSKKETTKRSRLEFVRVVRSQSWPTSTTKNF